MKKKEIVSGLEDFFKQNAAKYHVEMVFLYGSWAGGYPHKGSDIDLAVLFQSEVNDEENMFSLITDISYELLKCLKCEVNIISIFRDFRHPMLYYNAIVLGIPVFCHDWDRLIGLRLEALYQMEDFRIFGIPWQREVAGNLMRG